MNNKISKFQILCNFIYKNLKNKENKNYDFCFLIEQLKLGNMLFHLNSAQILALCFQFLVYFPMERNKNYYSAKIMLKQFFKIIKKTNSFKNLETPSFLFLPNHAFSSLTINKATSLLYEINFKDGVNLSSDAKILWDLNHMYLGFNLNSFLDFIDIEYNLFQHYLSEDEYLSVKKNQFISLINNKTVYQTQIFSKEFDQKAKNNLYSFVKDLSINNTIHYSS